MRARGYDRVLLEQAREAVERGKVADELITKISEAFRGVALGDGVGLQQAKGLDDYEDEATCAAYRENDEKEDWRAISSDDLNRCDSSLSFFDPEGMRFHLPAYMIAELRGEYGFGMSFRLTHLDTHGRSYFSALSPVQRQGESSFCSFEKSQIITSTGLRLIRHWRPSGSLTLSPKQPMLDEPARPTADNVPL